MTVRDRQFSNFGAMLRDYRESFGMRMYESKAVPVLGLKLPAVGLVESLNAAGYEISQSTYSEIEAGTSFPRYARKFIDTVCQCLGLEVGGKDWEALNVRLAQDIVHDRLGDQVVDLIPWNMAYKQKRPSAGRATPETAPDEIDPDASSPRHPDRGIP